MNAIKVTVEPPIRSNILPNAGTVSAVNIRETINRVRKRHLFQLNPSKFLNLIN
jgi:hypothetical protein